MLNWHSVFICLYYFILLFSGTCISSWSVPALLLEFVVRGYFALELNKILNWHSVFFCLYYFIFLFSSTCISSLFDATWSFFFFTILTSSFIWWSCSQILEIRRFGRYILESLMLNHAIFLLLGIVLKLTILNVWIRISHSWRLMNIGRVVNI